ncbi:MAG: tRNA adenosine(34) deaminase TadA [Lachnospiraceae bacterium]|nr:tRNA adenosine(34) deaminase TadA [Lachnospiraceae bacterium]
MKPEAAKNVKRTPLTPEEDIIFMKKALKQAEHALELGEVPIGCVIVYDKKIIGRGFNKRNTKKTALAHAEITAISQACRKLGDWRLDGCTMYVTLEPCQMCSGAIVQSRIDRIVIGAANPKAGCAGSILNLLDRPEFNHQVEITRDICAEESTAILQKFFKQLRKSLRSI